MSCKHVLSALFNSFAFVLMFELGGAQITSLFLKALATTLDVRAQLCITVMTNSAT